MAIDLAVCLIDRADDPSDRFAHADVETVLRSLRCSYEIVHVEFDPRDEQRDIAAGGTEQSIRIVQPRNYRQALATALAQTTGNFIVTTDTFLAADLHFLLNFWSTERSDLAIASRFLPGGVYRTGRLRRVTARGLNRIARRVLSLPYYDLTSAFRMYRRGALAEALELTQSDSYDFLVESIVHLHGLGRSIVEVPYVSRRAAGGRVNVPGGEVARSVVSCLPRLWRTRNSVFSADYDERAFNSLIWPQRYWQRKRFEIITDFVESPAEVLDIGCGSSKVIQAYPGAIGLDIQLKKLRYLLRRHTQLVQGSVFQLPFANASFRTVICSEVIEHIPFDEVLFSEFHRVLKPGGVLVLGTPDYGRKTWPTIEWVYERVVPGGYAHEHITHYTQRQLEQLVRAHGFDVQAARAICGAELILKCRKRAS